MARALTSASQGTSQLEARRKPFDATSLVISLAFLTGAIIAARKHKAEVVAAAPMFCCMVFLSPLAWKVHFVGLILPTSYLAARAIAESSRLIRRLATLAFASAFGLFALTTPASIGLRAGEWADQHSLDLLGAVVTYLAVLF